MVVVRTQEPLTFVPRDWILWFQSFVPVATDARVAPGVMEPVHVAQAPLGPREVRVTRGERGNGRDHAIGLRRVGGVAALVVSAATVGAERGVGGRRRRVRRPDADNCPGRPGERLRGARVDQQLRDGVQAHRYQQVAVGLRVAVLRLATVPLQQRAGRLGDTGRAPRPIHLPVGVLLHQGVRVPVDPVMPTARQVSSIRRPPRSRRDGRRDAIGRGVMVSGEVGAFRLTASQRGARAATCSSLYLCTKPLSAAFAWSGILRAFRVGPSHGGIASRRTGRRARSRTRPRRRGGC